MFAASNALTAAIAGANYESWMAAHMIATSANEMEEQPVEEAEPTPEEAAALFAL